jgi:hypothetical protein
VSKSGKVSEDSSQLACVRWQPSGLNFGACYTVTVASFRIWRGSQFHNAKGPGATIKTKFIQFYGERGIRTLDTCLHVYTISNRAPSTARTSLQFVRGAKIKLVDEELQYLSNTILSLLTKVETSSCPDSFLPLQYVSVTI